MTHHPGDEAWFTAAKGLVRIEMVRRDISYGRLVELLRNELGVVENERNLRNKIARGTFSTALFLQCMAAMEVHVLHIGMLLLLEDVATKSITSAQDYLEGDAESKKMIAKIEAIVEAGRKVEDGE